MPLTVKLIFLPCNFTSVCTILLPPLFAIEQRRKVKIPRRTSVLANCTYDVHLLIGRASCNTVEYFKFFTPKVKSFTYLIRTFVCFLGPPNYVSMKIHFKHYPSRAVHCVCIQPYHVINLNPWHHIAGSMLEIDFQTG